MKVLAICHHAGSGISVIYERIIGELCRYAEVDVLADYTPDIQGVRNTYTHQFSKQQRKWTRKLLHWFGVLPIVEKWSRQAVTLVADDYDIVMGFMASSQLMPMVCGRYIAQKLNCKFGIYAVDAIPGPGGWTKPHEYRSKLKAIRNYYQYADYVASSNPHMLDFQLTTFSHKPGLQTGVLLTPSPDEEFVAPPSTENILLYTGSLYGKRNPNHIFKAFKRLLATYPDAQFIMIGLKIKLRKAEKHLSASEREHIQILKPTNNLAPLFARAKVLIDIDADLDTDPFLSSKIVSYLKVNRVILSETGTHSPSRDMFRGLETIIQCNHNADSLYEGLIKAMNMADSNPDFSERNDVIQQFSIKTVGRKLADDLQKLLG
ncbi:MAG: glycosyltransferase family 4 protein [Rikenellaceae bacterium]|nr:glycosyltransferase family 4 protein [Rikenellaceae bacterium]